MLVPGKKDLEGLRARQELLLRLKSQGGASGSKTFQTRRRMETLAAKGLQWGRRDGSVVKILVAGAETLHSVPAPIGWLTNIPKSGFGGIRGPFLTSVYRHACLYPGRQTHTQVKLK